MTSRQGETCAAGVFDAPPTPDERARDLAMPRDIDRRVLAKAQEIRRRADDPQEKIEAVLKFLLRNNPYSLTTNAGSGRADLELHLAAQVRPLRVFRLRRRHPAARAGCPDALRQRLLRPRVGRQGLDPGPAAGRPRLGGKLGGRRGLGDGGRDAGQWPPGPTGRADPVWWRAWEGMQDLLGAIRQLARRASWLDKTAVFGLLVLGLLIPQLYRYWQRRRLASQGFRYTRPDAALAALAARFEALLARRGLPCPEGRTWREHLRVIADKEVLPMPPLEVVRAGLRAGALWTAARPRERSRGSTPSCAR